MADGLPNRSGSGASHILTPLTERQAEASPETPLPSSNPAWNRSAEAVGRSLGATMAEVKRLPRQLDRLTSRIHLVGKSAGEATADAAGSAASKAGKLRHSAETSLLELMETVMAYNSVGPRVGRRAGELRRAAWCRLRDLRQDARQRLDSLRNWKAERPEKVILACAVAAFTVGAALRIWRLNRD